MITAHVTRIDQSLNLDTQKLENFLVFMLPDGTECRSPITDEVAKRVMRLSRNGSSTLVDVTAKTAEDVESATSPDVEPYLPQEGEAEPPEEKGTEEPLYRWEDLPDESLSRRTKTAMRLVGAPPEMTANDIRQVINNISEQFEDDDWDAVDSAMAMEDPEPPAPPPPPAPRPAAQAPAPPLNQVQWADGAPIVSGTMPSRTVQADAKGNPIVDNNDVDPGEVVAGGDTDEDGVGQL